MKIARRYYVNFENLPDPKREYVQSFENLNGGLNLYDLDYLLKSNESPEMKKGGTRSEILKSLEPLVRRGHITMEEAMAWADQEALYDLVGFIPLNELMKEETA